MIAKLVLLFTIVPILELTLLITLGDYIGLPWTIAIVVTTALLGATLGKYQGLSAWRKIKAELSAGQLPQDALMDGLAVLLASAFLITPGVLTDLAAFTLLLPATRAPLKRLLKRRIDRWLESEPIGCSPVRRLGRRDADGGLRGSLRRGERGGGAPRRGDHRAR